MSHAGGWSGRKAWAIGLLGAAVVALFADDLRTVGALAGYLGIAVVATLLRDRLPAPARRTWVALSLIGLTLLLLALRKSPALLLLAHPIDRPRALRAMLTENASVLGLSYCWLRAIYALLDPRRWDLRSLLGYHLFPPTFFSGPVMSPAETIVPAPSAREAFTGGLARIADGVIRIAASYLLLSWIPLGNEAGVAEAVRSWPVWMLWGGVVLSGVWLYLNFSGFSAAAIGLSLWLGVRAPENFDHPYGATDLTAFWQRWHISLGLWLRAHVYDPLSRRAIGASPRARFVASLLLPIVTMTVCGAWHMLTPAFLLWGLLHGLGLAVHALWRRVADKRVPRSVQAHLAYQGASWALTHAFVGMTWALFLPTVKLPLSMRLDLLAALFGVRS